MYYTTAEATGDGTFPLDMLRYDCCFPADMTAVDNMLSDVYANLKRRTVKLGRYTALKSSRAFTPARWESFGWKLTILETRKI